jgi:molybdate-binding protein/transcriptional regulator with XRE-family HTH domain
MNSPGQRIQQRRQAKEWSQADLARLAGISRAAVSAIEGDKLAPSVNAAIALSHVLGCTVEMLFGQAEPEPQSECPWSWAPRSHPTRYWEAKIGSRVLRYPVEALSFNPLPHDGVQPTDNHATSSGEIPEGTLTMACCDPAAGLLASEFARRFGLRLLVFPRSGARALELLGKGLVHVAGLHRSTRECPEQNSNTVRNTLGEGYRLLRVADWEEGVVVRPGDPSISPKALVKRSVQWAARESGSAARECLDELLNGRHFSGREVDGHGAVSEAVHSGWADAGICVRLCAEESGLSFHSLRTESLDFCFSKSMESDRRIQSLIRLLRTHAYRRMIQDLPGYETRQMGDLATV